MAISADGFVATKDGDSDWVSPVDSKGFESKIAEMGCIIVGNRTFEQYQADLYPVAGVGNIVISSKKHSKPSEKNIFYAASAMEAIKIGEKHGYTKALLIGGGTTNGMFFKEGLINDLFLSVHPLVLGDGIRLFEKIETQTNLSFIDLKQLDEGLVQLHYKMSK